MHMWMWFGYELGEFMFPGLTITLRWQFALTWIVLFFIAMLFEGSKVYVAKVQREALKKLYPFRSDERRNLLCDRQRLRRLEEPGSSRDNSTGQVRRWASLKLRLWLNAQQTLVVSLHNTVGYGLMLAVMVYNVHLLIAVVTGMMLGYFLFGPKLTRFQMQCYSTRVVICTPECDDTAEGTTPPLLDSSAGSESDLFICRTRTCVQPSHYFPAQGPSTEHPATCYYGAKQCPSMVARAKRLQASTCHRIESEKEDSPSVEDAQLLRTERQGCCKKKQEPPPAKCSKKQEPPPEKCCKKQEPPPEKYCKETKPDLEPIETNIPVDNETEREDSPQISCCHATASSDSQEQIIK